MYARDRCGRALSLSLFSRKCPENLFRKRVARRNKRNSVYSFPGVGYPCAGSAMTQWIQRTDVRQALNVPVNSNFFNSDNGNDFTYYVTEQSVLPFYVKQLRNSKMRTLVYNGDTDPSLSSFRTQAAWFPFLQANNIPITQEWRPWTMDNRTDVRGYVTKFFDNSRFAYVTIRGSGHMVQPEAGESRFGALTLPSLRCPSSAVRRRSS